MILSLGQKWLCTQSSCKEANNCFYLIPQLMEPGSRPKPSARHISQLPCSSVISQVLSTSLGWSGPRKQSSTEESCGQAAKPQQKGQKVHFTISDPGPNPAWQSCATSGCILQIRKRCLWHLRFCGLLHKRKLALKGHVLSGCFSSPKANRAADISL